MKATITNFMCDGCGNVVQDDAAKNWWKVELGFFYYGSGRDEHIYAACSMACRAAVLRKVLEESFDLDALRREAAALRPDLTAEIAQLKVQVADQRNLLAAVGSTAPAEQRPVTHDELRAIVREEARAAFRWLAGRTSGALESPLRAIARRIGDLVD